MPFDATVYRVLIASPGDVTNERKAVADLIAQWNRRHAAERGIVFLPRMWETDSTPSMEAPPQDVINRQIVDDADLLIGVFWQKLGTPTERDLSGTVEEINRVIDRRGGANVLLYFSDKPVPPRSLNAAEFEKLEAFRAGLKKRGLFRHFKNAPDLVRLLESHLTDRASEFGGRPLASRTEPEPGPTTPWAEAGLSASAGAFLKAITRAALTDPSRIVYTSHLVGDQDFRTLDGDAVRDAADVLRRRGLIKILQDVSIHGLTIAPTDDGMALAVPEVVPDFGDHEEGVRATICQLSPTTVDVVATHLGLAPGIVQHIAERFAARRMLRVRKYLDPMTKLDDPSPELCPRRKPATPKPKNLTRQEHEIIGELVRRVAIYPDVFDRTIWKLPAGDDKQPYQSSRIGSLMVPEDAKEALYADRDFLPLLIQQGYLHAIGKHDFRLDDAIFAAYGFDVPEQGGAQWHGWSEPSW